MEMIASADRRARSSTGELAASLVRALRHGGHLKPPFAAHVTSDVARIGWGAAERLGSLDDRPAGWPEALSAIADRAAGMGRPAFGYVGFEAGRRAVGVAPDGACTFPLVQFFVPTHYVEIRDGRSSYTGPDPSLVEQLDPAPDAARTITAGRPLGQWSADAFSSAVEQAKAYLDESLTKVVLSRYFAYSARVDVLDIFTEHCLRQSCSDAIVYDFGDVGAAIASPELLVRVDGDALTTRPLAGTCRRGATAEQDERAARTLLHDRKELAEHVLAVRQMLEELRPVCAPGSLGISQLLDIVRLPRVLHLGSTLRGRLAAGYRGVDALAALFPSAMVSGVPRDAALRVIDALEPFDRGIFGGASGWVQGRGCRLALNIRGIYRYGDRQYVQAGAGILAESDPRRETAEIDAKLSALRAALGPGGP